MLHNFFTFQLRLKMSFKITLNSTCQATFERIAMTSYYVSLTSFFASKVDESIGASYMALLWTITNMSALICDTGAMWLTGQFEKFNGLVPSWDAFHYLLALVTLIRLELDFL